MVEVVTAVTVRLPLAVPPFGGECTVEFHGPDGAILRGDAVVLGPAAPADAGRVGTVGLDWKLPLAPDEAFSVVVRDPATGEQIISVDYPALRKRVGPGALARPRGGDTGTVSFQVADSWWRGLALPDLE